MSAKKDKSGKRRTGAPQILVTGNTVYGNCRFFSSNTSFHVYLAGNLPQYLKELGY